MKRVVTIQDISCFGRCSITVALPIISAAGIELTPLPNVVLSTHTGGFTNIARCEMTDFIPKAAEQWQQLGLEFDAIYIGYIGSSKQFDMVSDFIKRFRRENTIVVVDPVMGDAGKLYNGITCDFPKEMAKLCTQADYIVPNMTEAALLAGEKYRPSGYDNSYVKNMLKTLAKNGSKNVVITSVEDGDGNIGAAYLTQSGEMDFSMLHRESGKAFHGAGDTFASCLVAALVNGKPIERAVDISVRFVSRAIQKTIEAGTDLRFGLYFEPCLPYFIELINKN